AVVIGAEHVDEALVAARDLVFVVGDVAREIGVLAVALLDDAILVVLEIGRLEKERALLALEPAAPLELVERGGDLAPAVDALLREPHVELDAQLAERLLDARELLRTGHAIEHARDGDAHERIVVGARLGPRRGGVLSTHTG